MKPGWGRQGAPPVTGAEAEDRPGGVGHACQCWLAQSLATMAGGTLGRPKPEGALTIRPRVFELPRALRLEPPSQAQAGLVDSGPAGRALASGLAMDRSALQIKRNSVSYIYENFLLIIKNTGSLWVSSFLYNLEYII